MRLSLALIILLLFLTTVLPEAPQEQPTANKAGKDTLRMPVYSISMALLRLSAGKKAGYTPHKMDSLQTIISIRKKF